jgi:tetratricopeptide (TPR) repeat protein
MQHIRLLRKACFSILALLSLAAPGSGEAGDRREIETAEAAVLQIVQLAMERRFAELETKVAEHKAFAETHPDKDVGFSDIFDPFRRADPNLAGPLKEWRAKYPNSFAPYMAFGAYSTHLGWVVRGEDSRYLIHAKRLEEMRRYFDEAVSALRTGIRLYPKVPKAWTRLIGIAASQGDVVEVEEIFKEAVRHVPRSSYLYRTYYDVLAPKWVGSGAQQYGLKFRIQGMFAGNPDFGWIETIENHDKAWSLYWRDELEAALAIFDKIISVNPDFSSRQGRASTLADLNRVDDSVDEYHRALALDPGNPKIYSQLAFVQSRKLEARESAARNLDRALIFDPYNPEFLRRRARMYLDRNEPETAKRDLDKALLLGAYNDQVRDQLRRYYWTVEDMGKAIEEAQKMIALAPARTNNWFLYAITLQKNRDCRALEAFETYLRQCLMRRECGEPRQQEITLNIYNMKQACS